MELLHFDVRPGMKEYYVPLSYWSVVEIIAKAFMRGLHSNIRIGAREDMDIIEKVPAVYCQDGTFNRYDFWIYDAVQRFSADKDILALLCDIQRVLEGERSLDRDENGDEKTSFKVWKRDTRINEPAIDTCLDLLKGQIARKRRSRRQKLREAFLDSVFKVLDRIELPASSQTFARELRCEDSEEKSKKKAIERFINKHVKSVLSSKYETDVRMIFFERAGRRLLRVYFQLINAEDKCLHDIWVGIPTEPAAREDG